MEAFVNWVSPTLIEDEIRGLIVSLINKAVTSTFPDAEVRAFGSYETKLYLPLGYVCLSRVFADIIIEAIYNITGILIWSFFQIRWHIATKSQFFTLSQIL